MLGISAVLAAFTVGGGILFWTGLQQSYQFKPPKQVYQGSWHSHLLQFQQLAQAVGKPVKFVKKDIKRMISKGWFLQGHVDKQETCRSQVMRLTTNM